MKPKAPVTAARFHMRPPYLVRFPELGCIGISIGSKCIIILGRGEPENDEVFDGLPTTVVQLSEPVRLTGKVKLTLV